MCWIFCEWLSLWSCVIIPEQITSFLCSSELIVKSNNTSCVNGLLHCMCRWTLTDTLPVALSPMTITTVVDNYRFSVIFQVSTVKFLNFLVCRAVAVTTTVLFSCSQVFGCYCCNTINCYRCRSTPFNLTVTLMTNHILELLWLRRCSLQCRILLKDQSL